MSGTERPLSSKLVFYKGWMVYLPFLMLIMCNYFDQYFITFQGGTATKAYTLAMTIYWILVTIGTVISAFMAVHVRRRIDQNDREGANRMASNAIVYTVIFSVANSFIVSTALVPMVVTLPDDGVTDALREFLKPLFLLNFAMAANLVLMGMLAALGHRRKYLVCIGITLFGEMFFNPFFIFVCHLGVFGNGLGTAVSLSASGILALYWFLRGKVEVRLSWRLVDWSPRNIWGAAMRIRDYVVKNVATHVGELLVRLQLYVTYTLTYGIPMLYSSFIVILGSGSAAASSGMYRDMYLKKDFDGALALLRGSVVETFMLMLIAATLMYSVNDLLIAVFINHSDLVESEEIAVWTLDVLCFSAPFLGLKPVCGAVFVDRPLPALDMAVTITGVVVRTVILVSAIWYEYPLLIFLIFFERVFVGALSVYRAWRYIGSKKAAVQAPAAA